MRNSLAPVWALLVALATGCVTDDAASGDAGLSAEDRDGDGVSAAAGDCDDGDPSVSPDAVDLCDDGIDQDCDGRDPRCDTQDDDLDGFTVAAGDCDDTDPGVSPERAEICGDGIDQDCSGADLDCVDADQDRDGFSPNQGDCDDQDVALTPGRLETCDDGNDQDCDGRDLPCDEVDQDGDGYSVADGDCDDASLRIYPGASELCENGRDEDCDGRDTACANDDRDGDGVPDGEDLCPDVADLFQPDRDQDGVGDACDNCPGVRNADQADADADGEGDACDGDVDGDGDGVLGRDGDCDDSDPAVRPGAAEQCNTIDDDCNGFIDDGCPSDLRSPLVAIPAGETLLGSQDADPATCARDPRSDENCDEVPQATIRLSAFAIEAHEVTNRQYAACADASRCTPPLQPDVASGRRYADPAFAEHPVVWVRQGQASAYCRWAGRKLPSEAQWERAARDEAPLEQRRYPWGDAAPDCETANVNNCDPTPRAVGTTAGDRTASSVFDLGGNVHEITDGFYLPGWYRGIGDDPVPPAQPGERDQIPVRGGGHRSAVAFSTLTYRGFRLLMSSREGRPDVGFRCLVE